MKRAAAGLAAAALAVLAVACGGGLKTVGKDGYRAILSFSKDERFEVAVRGEWKRVEARMDGAPLVKIMRPDLKQVWQFRPSTKKILATPWEPTEEIVPGYPLEPHFDPAAYADRFGGTIARIGDAAHGLHPCDRYRMSLPSGDQVTLWVARDLEKLVVKIEHAKKDQGDEYQPFTTTELLDVRVGADPDLFEKPKGYNPAKNVQELLK
ncbi:MAG TPA: hypothetical protein VMH79_11745 [Thermoanaerobaculia bacterium]|nr:hypothetical protein [Thermoanaerobaculia bacterium]